MSPLRMALAVLALLISAPFASAQTEATPSAVIESFQNDLLEVMRSARRLDVAQRYERLLPAVEKSFNLRVMIRTIVGRHWDDATAEQRERLSVAFKQMNIATVATLFDGYSGQVFEIFGDVPGPQETRLVQTRIVSPDRSSVKLVYRMIKLENRWQIIDVIVDDGISETQTRRSEYAKALSEGGVDRLSSVLAAKAKELLGS